MNSPVGTAASADNDDREVIEPVVRADTCRPCGRARRGPARASAASIASGMSSGPTQIDQKSRKNVAWMMWKRIDAVSTSPAIQCHCTQANLTPTIGRNAVNSSTNIDAAITQWNSRAVRRVPLDLARADPCAPPRARRSRPRSACGAPRTACSCACATQEQHAGEQRRPEQVPRDVGQDPLAPRIPSPRQEVHAPPSARGWRASPGSASAAPCSRCSAAVCAPCDRHLAGHRRRLFVARLADDRRLRRASAAAAAPPRR